jgi:RimJ/RimL family protein N-acetyltransferase
MDLKFTPFRPADLAEYAAWFADGDTARRISNPDATWLAHVMGEAGAWAVRDMVGALVAVLEAEPHSDRAYISVTVAPERRGQGIGAECIRMFHTGPGAGYAVLEGRIAPHNAASLAMVKKAGFILTSPDPDADGMLRFELRRRR